jgi:2-dehydro-3-deoxygluconokinase
VEVFKTITMGKILCFGELLLRFSPAADGQWLRSGQLPVHLGGAELNVATALGRWNLPVSYCSALPDNYLSKDILEILKERQLLTDHILFSGDRIGSYYLSPGTDLKNHSVIYDRAHSAFGELKKGMFDWEHVLQDVSWLHFSAISPALDESVAAVCMEMLLAASKKNITISIDLNHRPKLWKQKNPHKLMQELLPCCDVVMGNIWSAHDLLGVPLDQQLIQANDKTAYLEHAHQTAVHIQKRFARVKTVAFTFRFEEEGHGILYYASLHSANRWINSSVYRSENIVDKVGTGDCFMAGLIYGLYKQLPEQEIIQFATSAGFGKFFEEGDSTKQVPDTVLARIQQYE